MHEIMILKLLLLFGLLRSNAVSKTFDFLDENKKLICYNQSSSYLSNIQSLNTPKNGSIFFIECSCRVTENGYLPLSSRQACSIESAARAHPYKQIFVLVTSLGKHKHKNGSAVSQTYGALSQYNNIRFAHINYYEFFKNSPLDYEQIYISESERYPFNKASSALRLVALWRYGGICLDTDTIVLKPFDELSDNFMAMQNQYRIGNAILGFGRKDQVVSNFVERLGLRSLNINRFPNPSIITNLTTELYKLYNEHCTNLKIHDSTNFYPIRWNHWSCYFNQSRGFDIFRGLQKSYALHFWNKMSKTKYEAINSNILYATLAREYCPEVANGVNKYI